MEDGTDASVNHRPVMRGEFVVPELGLGFLPPRWRSLRQDLAQVGLAIPRGRLCPFFLAAAVGPVIVLLCITHAISSRRRRYC